MKKVIILVSLALLPLAAQTQWARTYGTYDEEAAYCARQTTDGGYIISGHSQLVDGCWLVKTDSLGEIEWTKDLEERFMFGGLSVQQTTDGGYIVSMGTRFIKLDSGGNTEWICEPSGSWFGQMEWVEQTSDGGYIATGSVIQSQDVSQLVLIKVEASGDVDWKYAYNMTWDIWDVGSYACETSDGGYIVCGSRDDLKNMWIIKTNAIGQLLWQVDTTLGWASRIVQTPDDGYVVSYNQGFLKLDSQGEMVWNKPHGEGSDIIFFFTQVPDGGFVATGVKFPPGQNTWDSRDIWLFKVSNSGDLIWNWVFGGNKQDSGYRIFGTSDGGYIVAAATASIGEGKSDYYVLKTDSEGVVDIKEEPLTQKYTWEVTAPIGREIVMRYRNIPDGFKASVFDAAGRQVEKIESLSSSGLIKWGNGFAQGVYFIVPEYEQLKSEKIVLIR